MILASDHELICKMLGVVEVPGPVEREYEWRIAFYHKSGASGPIGPVGIIDMLRHLDLRPAVKVVEDVVDWTRVAKGTAAEASYFGQWIPCEFQRVAGMGMLDVKFGDRVAEVHRGAVRLAEAKPEKPPAEATAEPAGPVDEWIGARVEVDGQVGTVTGHDDPWLTIKFDVQDAPVKKLARKAKRLDK